MALWLFLSVYVSLFLSFTYSQKWAIFYFEGSLLFHKYIIRKSVTTNVSFDYVFDLLVPHSVHPTNLARPTLLLTPVYKLKKSKFEGFSHLSKPRELASRGWN